MSPKDIALEGLEKGTVSSLKVMKIRGKGKEVVTTQTIRAGEYVTEYKYLKIHRSKKERDREVLDHQANGGEGSYILEIFLNGEKIHQAIQKLRKVCLSCRVGLQVGIFSAIGISTIQSGQTSGHIPL